MRSHPLNPRLSPAPGVAAAQPPPAAAAPCEAAPAAETAAPGPLPLPDEDHVSDGPASRAGGFHESSYELQHGLQVSESEWPDDVTVPAPLGDR